MDPSANQVSPRDDARTAVSVARPSRTVTAMAMLGIASGVMGTAGAAAMVFTSAANPPIGYLIGAPMGLVAAIGLLKRKNWARVGYIGAFGLGIATMLVTMVTNDRLGYIMPLAWCGISGLLIAKLCSRKVKA